MFTASMFQSIKSALAKDETQSNTSYREIMKLEPGKTYTVRLLPNITTPEKSFFHYFEHGWVSFATGQYVRALSLQTFGDRDPIAEERYKTLRLGTDEDKKKAETVRRSEHWMVNAYVVDDPTNPDNNGQVKIIRYGKQLAKVIDQAINGEDADEFGAKIFDLSKNGCSLKIKVEKQGDYPSYVSSRFTSPTDLNLSEPKIKDLYGKVHDLERVLTAKSHDELLEMWHEHFMCKSSIATTAAPVHQPTTTAVRAVTEPTSVSAPILDDDADELDDETVRELLKGLE
jgi:gp32 DNA binding protein like